MNKKTVKEFIRYCLVGVANTIVAISAALICLNIFSMSYAISTGISYILGIITSFYLNKKFTFKNKDSSLIQFIIFFGTLLPAYIASYWAGYKIAHLNFEFEEKILHFFMNFIAISNDKLIDNFAIFLSMIIYLIVGFSINKYIIFHKK